MRQRVDPDRVILGVRKRKAERPEALEERNDELLGLVEAAGGEVVRVFVQDRPEPDTALYLGRGKVLEMAEAVQADNASLVVFDGELSPAQIRNLGDRMGCRVIDRTQIILDIFAQRAQSKVGRLQVEVAQLEYLLPRLSGRGAEMSRLGGGIGTRGPGETRLEVDRRRIRDRISNLKSQLKEVTAKRAEQRKKRLSSVPTVALVGYTNAGKTTVLGRWTHDRGGVVPEPGDARLFDTLDPLARRVRAGQSGALVLLDTVGFVQDLPHMLVDAFRATLEEVVAADAIVHVLDASADTITRAQTTYQVLRELGAEGKPIITFYNKLDRVRQAPPPDRHARVTLYGSAKTGEGMAELYSTVDTVLGLDPVRVTLSGPEDSETFWSDVARQGRVVSAEPSESGKMHVTVEMDRRQTPGFGREHPSSTELQP